NELVLGGIPQDNRDNATRISTNARRVAVIKEMSRSFFAGADDYSPVFRLLTIRGVRGTQPSRHNPANHRKCSAPDLEGAKDHDALMSGHSRASATPTPHL